MGGLVHEEITKEIIGAAFEVHKALGPGFLEKVYEEALCYELSVRGLVFQRQVHVPIFYKRVPVGAHVVDLIVNEKVIIELKAINAFEEVHKAILLSYLTATKLQVGLLMNFGQPSLDIKRLVRQKNTA